MLACPPLVSVLVAFPFWRRDQMIVGNLVGTAVIFGSALALIFREHVELDRITQACLEASMVCWPAPSAFTRHAIYAFIGLLQVFVLFRLSLTVERRLRNGHYAPEWR